MGWSLGGIVIRPGDKGDVDSREASYAIQQVLDSTAETISWFAAGSNRRKLSFALFENDNGGTGKASLITKVGTDADVNLTGDLGSFGNFRIENISFARRQDFANTLPVYDCTAELIAV